MTTPTPSTDSLKNDLAVLQAVMSANKTLIGMERADLQQMQHMKKQLKKYLLIMI